MTVTEDHTAEIISAIERAAAELRRETAARVALAAAEGAPVDKGALQVSSYLTDEIGSDYTTAVSAAEAKNPKVEIVPEVPAEKDTTIISFAVAYALLNELYTGPANPGAHPFLTPAVEAERPAFEAAVEKIGK